MADEDSIAAHATNFQQQSSMLNEVQPETEILLESSPSEISSDSDPEQQQQSSQETSPRQQQPRRQAMTLGDLIPSYFLLLVRLGIIERFAMNNNNDNDDQGYSQETADQVILNFADEALNYERPRASNNQRRRNRVRSSSRANKCKEVVKILEECAQDQLEINIQIPTNGNDDEGEELDFGDVVQTFFTDHRLFATRVPDTLISLEQKRMQREKYESTDQKLKPDELCAICLNQLVNCLQLARLDACIHLFCYECIYQWATQNCNQCPLCKSKISYISYPINDPNHHNLQHVQVSDQQDLGTMTRIERNRVLLSRLWTAMVDFFEQEQVIAHTDRMGYL